jgi:hypothetical protein
LGVKKAKTGPQSPKMEFGAKNQYPSIGNTRRKKKYTLRVQNSENKASEPYTLMGKNRLPEPKNGIWGPKSVWSCDISIDRKFYME